MKRSGKDRPSPSSAQNQVFSHETNQRWPMLDDEATGEDMCGSGSRIESPGSYRYIFFVCCEVMRCTQVKNPSNGDGLFHPFLQNLWMVYCWVYNMTKHPKPWDANFLKILLKYSSEMVKRINFGHHSVLSSVNNSCRCLVGWLSISRTVRSAQLPLSLWTDSRADTRHTWQIDW